MVLMMNKQLAAYLTFYLKEAGLGADFVDRLVKRSICPELCHGINLCEWNKETHVLTTPADKDEDAAQDIENAAWYKDEFGDHMKGGGKEKKQYAAPEALYGLDDEHSVRTIHDKKGKGYSGSPGAEQLDLGENSAKRTVIDVDEDSDELSAISAMSKRDLIDLVRKSRISHDKGSAPSASEPYTDDSDNDSSSSSSGSSSSSSASSDGVVSVSGTARGG